MVVETAASTGAYARYKREKLVPASSPREDISHRLAQDYEEIVGLDGMPGLPFDRHAALFENSTRIFTVNSRAMPTVLSGVGFDEEIVRCVVGNEVGNKDITLNIRPNSVDIVNHTDGVSFGLRFIQPQEIDAKAAHRRKHVTDKVFLKEPVARPNYFFTLDLMDTNHDSYQDKQLLNDTRRRINQQYQVRTIDYSTGEPKEKWVNSQSGKSLSDRIGDPTHPEHCAYDADLANKFLMAVGWMVKDQLIELQSDSDKNMMSEARKAQEEIASSRFSLYAAADQEVSVAALSRFSEKHYWVA